VTLPRRLQRCTKSISGIVPATGKHRFFSCNQPPFCWIGRHPRCRQHVANALASFAVIDGLEATLSTQVIDALGNPRPVSWLVDLIEAEG
jgi:hypothetical protein